MKTMKKLASLLLALAMIFSLATTAFADTKNDSITVNGAMPGETYNLYKLFDLMVDDENNPTAYSYTVNSSWQAFFNGEGNNYITVNDKGYITEIKNGETGAAALANAAANWANKPGATASITVDTGATTAVFSGLEDGYWLITSTLGTFAMTRTTPAEQAVTVTEKNEVPSQDKAVQEETDSSWGETSDGEIGETVNYKVDINAKKGTTNYVLHDKMDAGLTFNENSVKITQNGTEVTSGWTLNKQTTDGCTFDIELSFLNGAAADSNVVVSYSATINENAVIAGTGNKNESFLKYGNAGETTHENVTTYVWEFNVLKYTGTDTPLANAKFSLCTDAAGTTAIKLKDNGNNVYLLDPNGTVTEITTDVTGKFTIKGLDSGTYYLKETDAPDGYNTLNETVTVIIDKDGNVKATADGAALAEKTVKVENKTGTELPSTGGMGTTLFYVLGGIMVAAAVVLLVTKKRMAN